LSPPTQVVPIAKHPPAKVMPLAKVDVAVVPEMFRNLASIPPLKVEVPVLETFNTPKVDVAAYRLVDDAVVANMFVVVALLEVEFIAVKFCKVVLPLTNSVPS
jgi:hypothetical protein